MNIRTIDGCNIKSVTFLSEKSTVSKMKKSLFVNKLFTTIRGFVYDAILQPISNTSRNRQKEGEIRLTSKILQAQIIQVYEHPINRSASLLLPKLRSYLELPSNKNKSKVTMRKRKVSKDIFCK